MPQGEDASGLTSAASKQQATGPGFSQRPPFPSGSVTVPVLRNFSFEYSPVLRLAGKPSPALAARVSSGLGPSSADSWEQP